MSDTLIKVEGVSKKFCRSLKKSLWYGMQDLGNELLGKRHGGNGELRPEEFWAMKDVSFDIKRGETVGIIGRNGSGKTTLLRMLSGLIKPDQGRIEMRGRVGGLIALGAGFNPILTGRENIYVNASVLGLGKREIDEKIGEIIDFAEIGEFIDAPVQNYSSGMTIRLGFAIATTLNPDVLLLDEVLAVGDEAFQRKCFERLDDLLSRRDKVLFFVSHNIRQVERVCSRGILIEHGHVQVDGSSFEACSAYQNITLKDEHARHLVAGGLGNFTGSGEVDVLEVRMFNAENSEPTDEIEMHAAATIRIRFRCHVLLEAPEIILGFHTPDSIYVASTSSAVLVKQPDIGSGEHYIECTVPDVMLVPGVYYVRLAFLDKYRRNMWDGHKLHLFKVVPNIHTNVLRMPQMTLVDMPFSWKLDSESIPARQIG